MEGQASKFITIKKYRYIAAKEDFFGLTLMKEIIQFRIHLISYLFLLENE